MAEREQPAAAPLRAGVPFPSPRPPRHSRGPVPTRPVPLPPSLPVLQIHLQDLPVALKEALHIALPGLVAQAADVHPRHPGNGGGGLAGPQPPLGCGGSGNGRAAEQTQPNSGDVREHAAREHAPPAFSALPEGGG